jgi:hypothetical protein
VNLATTVRDGSLTFTTWVLCPSSLIFTFSVTLSVNTARSVRNSVAMGGGACADDGSTFRMRMRTAINAAPAAAPSFLVMSFLLPSADRAPRWVPASGG